MGSDGPHDRSETAPSEDETRWSQWMALANAGSADAYTKLLDEIATVMEQYLRRRFGDGEFVEDCVQECLLAIHRARASYDPSRRFRPWMFAIVRHKAIDMLRRRETRARYVASEPEIHESPAPRTDATAALQATELLAALAPEYRDALLMTKLEGRSLDEAARRAGVSVTAMKSRVHRGIKKVRDLLALEED